MLASAALDTAVGLILVYLVLSLVCSAINEILEGYLRHRSAELERGLRELLADPDGTTFVRQLYGHPLVCSLFKGTYDPSTTTNLPSYISSRSFALALMDIVLPATAATLSGAAGAVGNPMAPTTTSVAAFRTAAEAITGNPQLRRALLAIIDASGDDAPRVRANLENWFNAAMDRVAGWYKRRKQFIILTIGFVVTVAMNVSTVTVAETLWANQSMRETVAAAAQDYMQAENARRDQAQAGGAVEPPRERLARNLDELRSFGLPIGWGVPLDWPSRGAGFDPWARFLARLLFASFGGWVLTAFAISLGAPFWFDLLNKFTVVRSALKPQEKRP